MSRAREPDYIVKLPVEGVWHRLGAAWKDDGGSVNVALNVGVFFMFSSERARRSIEKS